MGSNHVCQVRIQSASPVHERVKISTIRSVEINGKHHRAMDKLHKFYVNDIVLGGHMSDGSKFGGAKNLDGWHVASSH